MYMFIFYCILYWISAIVKFMNKIKMVFFTAAFLALVTFSTLLPAKAYAQDISLNSFISMMSGITFKITPVEFRGNEMPTWFGIVYDTTVAEESFPAFAQAECFAYLPCYKVEIVPKWSWLFSFLSAQNVTFPVFYASDLIPEMTPAYIEAYCMQPTAVKRNWAIQVVDNENAYSYLFKGVHCSSYKISESKAGPYISEVTFNLGNIISGQ